MSPNSTNTLSCPQIVCPDYLTFSQSFKELIEGAEGGRSLMAEQAEDRIDLEELDEQLWWMGYTMDGEDEITIAEWVERSG